MKKNQNLWIPMADIMTSLMIIFLLIVIILFDSLSKSLNTIADQGEEIEKIDERFLAIEEIKYNLYTDLNNSFKDKKEEWGFNISEDLTIQFFNPEILFEMDSSLLTTRYKEILDEFFPKYLKIISQEKYQNKIKEIAIEGHTSNFTEKHYNYIKTVELSQDRSRNILNYILQNNVFLEMNDEEKERIIFLFTANGYGNSRTIDEDKKYTYINNTKASLFSRRVEFKIITSDIDLINNIKD